MSTAVYIKAFLDIFPRLYHSRDHPKIKQEQAWNHYSIFSIPNLSQVYNQYYVALIHQLLPSPPTLKYFYQATISLS